MHCSSQALPCPCSPCGAIRQQVSAPPCKGMARYCCPRCSISALTRGLSTQQPSPLLHVIPCLQRLPGPAHQSSGAPAGLAGPAAPAAAARHLAWVSSPQRALGMHWLLLLNREWEHVGDRLLVLLEERIGNQCSLPPCRGGSSSASRLQLVPLLCALLGAVAPRAKGATTPTGEQCNVPAQRPFRHPVCRANCPAAAAPPLPAPSPTAAAPITCPSRPPPHCAAAANSLGRRLSLGSGEVTLDCLESVDAGGEPTGRTGCCLRAVLHSMLPIVGSIPRMQAVRRPRWFAARPGFLIA